MTDFIIKHKRLVCGVGVNDSNYLQKITKELPRLDGKRNQKTLWTCPYYVRWTDMLKRSFSKKFKSKHPTYKDVTCCDEWITFSNFKSWMEQQDYEGKQLDKDLLVYKNKIYSPETCCFIKPSLNVYLTSGNKQSGPYPLGVYFSNSRNLYVAQCRNGKGKNQNLGGYSTAVVAHQAWQVFKYQMALVFYSEEENEKIKEGILRVYNKIKNDYDNNLITEDF